MTISGANGQQKGIDRWPQQIIIDSVMYKLFILNFEKGILSI